MTPGRVGVAKKRRGPTGLSISERIILIKERESWNTHSWCVRECPVRAHLYSVYI